MKSSESKKDKAIGIRLPLETFQALKARADAERRSLSNYLLLLIERDLHQSAPSEHPDPRHQALRQLEPSAIGKISLPPGVEIISPDPPIDPVIKLEIPKLSVNPFQSITRREIDQLHRSTHQIREEARRQTLPPEDPPGDNITLNEPTTPYRGPKS
jgi:hypothetical protein